MPFQSEKQRRFLHANHPEIAKRWEREYSHGGILDINASEEIISDDGNDIELTDYNAAFDDPNDLSTGVKGLFQAKDGGTPQLAQKSKDGKRPGYGGPHDSYDAGQSYSGSQNTGDGNTNRERGIQQAYSQPAYSPTGDASVAEQIAAADRKRKQEFKDVTKGTLSDPHEKYEDTIDQYSFTKVGTDKRKALDTKRYNERKAELEAKLKKSLFIKGLMLIAGIPVGIKDLVAVDWKNKSLKGPLKTAMDLSALNKEYISKLEGYKQNYKDLGIPDFSPHTDTAIQTLDQEILDLTQTDGEEDKKGDGPTVNPVTLEVDEEYAQGDYDFDSMSNWNAMKQKQALNAALQEKWAAEQEAYDQSFLVANSGGLANLFRVKNNK
jgi:hypothetical protein